MHFVTGGAYNGKKQWIKNYYHLDTTRHHWLSAYKGESYTKTEQNDLPAIVVLEGMERWIKTQITMQKSMDSLVAELQTQLDIWLQWEKQSEHHQLIMIGTDITKGIVPIEKKDRYWRDVAGWVYQYVTKQSTQMNIVWYGIAEKIK